MPIQDWKNKNELRLKKEKSGPAIYQAGKTDVDKSQLQSS